MAEEDENHTIRLLQEMRSEMRALSNELRETRTDLTQRMDGNTLLLNLVAGMLRNHEERISALEAARP